MFNISPTVFNFVEYASETSGLQEGSFQDIYRDGLFLAYIADVSQDNDGKTQVVFILVSDKEFIGLKIRTHVPYEPEALLSACGYTAKKMRQCAKPFDLPSLLIGTIVGLSINHIPSDNSEEGNASVSIVPIPSTEEFTQLLDVVSFCLSKKSYEEVVALSCNAASFLFDFIEGHRRRRGLPSVRAVLS